MTTSPKETDKANLFFAMNLSLAVGLLMFAMKVGAYLLTGSAAILSDAAESVVHVAAVIFASYSIRLSFRPADKEHPYGHAKIVFFSVGFEGLMIIIAGLYIVFESLHHWIVGSELSSLGAGATITMLAVLINGGLGWYLVRMGRLRKSSILTANGKHTLTDCWTGIAVVVGVGLVLLTKWAPFDSICGLLLAGNILWTGSGLVKSAYSGLMDEAPPDRSDALIQLLDRETKARGITFHGFRRRDLGDSHSVELHLVFPDTIALHAAHEMATEIEESIQRATAHSTSVLTHLECESQSQADHP